MAPLSTFVATERPMRARSASRPRPRGSGDEGGLQSSTRRTEGVARDPEGSYLSAPPRLARHPPMSAPLSVVGDLWQVVKLLREKPNAKEDHKVAFRQLMLTLGVSPLHLEAT